MTGFTGLAIPGPTNMPFQVRQAMDVPLEDHRAPDFPSFTLPLLQDLKKSSEQKRAVFSSFRVLVQADGICHRQYIISRR